MTGYQVPEVLPRFISVFSHREGYLCLFRSTVLWYCDVITLLLFKPFLHPPCQAVGRLSPFGVLGKLWETMSFQRDTWIWLSKVTLTLKTTEIDWPGLPSYSVQLPILRAPLLRNPYLLPRPSDVLMMILLDWDSQAAFFRLGGWHNVHTPSLVDIPKKWPYAHTCFNPYETLMHVSSRPTDKAWLKSLQVTHHDNDNVIIKYLWVVLTIVGRDVGIQIYYILIYNVR